MQLPSVRVTLIHPDRRTDLMLIGYFRHYCKAPKTKALFTYDTAFFARSLWYRVWRKVSWHSTTEHFACTESRDFSIFRYSVVLEFRNSFYFPLSSFVSELEIRFLKYSDFRLHVFKTGLYLCTEAITDFSPLLFVLCSFCFASLSGCFQFNYVFSEYLVTSISKTIFCQLSSRK